MKMIVLTSLIFFTTVARSQNNEGFVIDRMPAVSIDSFRIAQLAEEIGKGTFPNIHSLLITRHGKLVFERYWPGSDEIIGNSIGVVPHHKDSLHDVRSISKSIVSACVGIAIKQGRIKSVSEKVFDFFPEYKQFDTGWKSMLTIEHLLTMTSGLVWNEDIPYDNPDNSEIRMLTSADPMKYVLEQPMEIAPGKLWKYNGGTTQLLGAIIQKVSGLRLDKFAAQYLFKPIGITKYDWLKFPNTSMPMAASGVRLRSRDLLKFGLLYYQNGKNLLPPGWVDKSFQKHITTKYGGYGYQFWLFEDVVAAVGNGDQRIFFDKRNDLVVVITAGNYNKWDIPKNAAAIMREYIVPAVIKD